MRDFTNDLRELARRLGEAEEYLKIGASRARLSELEIEKSSIRLRPSVKISENSKEISKKSKKDKNEKKEKKDKKAKKEKKEGIFHEGLGIVERISFKKWTIEIEKIVPNRPMTHDLFKSFAASFHFDVEEILISDLKEGVFYAKIICSDGRNKVEVDARPSDAIAIGLRFNVPIYTVESIMSEAGILLSDITVEESSTENIPAEKKIRKPKQTKDKNTQIENLSSDQLKTMLEVALKNEDYENAARLRDELNKRN